MKPIALILLGITMPLSLAAANKPEAKPTGELSINLAMVRQGVAPKLTWSIQHPTVITDVVDIPPTDEIDPKTKLRVKISMVGVGLTDQWGRQYPSKSHIKFGNSNWQHLFTGRSRDVKPNKVLVDRIIQPGEKLRFASRVNYGSFNTYYNQSDNITILKNGDTPPNVSAGYAHQTPVASYLRPYIKNGKIAIGPMDLLYVSELTHSNKNHYGYDMQDTIVLVSFEKVESK